MTKTELRIKYKNIRNNITPDECNFKSTKIFENIINSKLIEHSNSVFIYLSYGREVNTEKITKYLFDQNKTVLIPKCNIKNETMIPVVYFKDEKLTDNFYGIKETDSQKEYTDNIDVIIMPGIAFDKYGNRIGHGKGYYDKFLQNKNILKIGLCYSECYSKNEIPSTDEDIAVDYVITDREVVKIKP